MPSAGQLLVRDRLPAIMELMARATNLAVEARRTLPAEAIVGKPDGSVVTAVDVALQVLILTQLAEWFGALPTIAEEDSASIGGKPAALAHCRVLLESWGVRVGGKSENGSTGIDEALHLGRIDGPTHDIDACWVLDPIDGTQGFIDGDHWCPCLALLSRGTPVCAVNGFPTILGGRVFTAEAGAGCWWMPLSGGEVSQAKVRTDTLPPDEVVRVVAPARATPSQTEARLAVGRSTGHDCALVHSDSQAKYGHVIAGLADVAYSRRGNGPGKYVWDHAGAVLLAREAGAWVGDTDGGEIDCSRGRRLVANNAVICAARGLGPAIARELAERDRVEGVRVHHARCSTELRHG
ncbi:MAG: inositol monophosphatase family protein [Limnohabitans sp.]|jgi:3'-phosphoadenosine 5'-phosphosulfate (PAPS) 3'-phosphatase|nr:inositol monophosphatase family protein [Limnohabitans sp.]